MTAQASFSDFIEQMRYQYGLGLPGKSGQQPLKPYVGLDRFVNPPANPKARKGAVLALFYPVEETPHLALIQRPEYEGVHGGQISFPGGKVEAGDKSLLDTALREATEEVGIDPGQVKVIGPMTEVYVLASNFLVYPFLAYTQQRPDFLVDPHEVDELLEVPFHQFMDEERVLEKVIRSVRGFDLKAPYYDVADRVLWGATAMMISEIAALASRP